MKGIISLFLLSGRLLFGGTSIEDSVVKVYQTHNIYDYSSPWSAPFQEKMSGSGFIISGNRILTNAHLISDAVFIQVKKTGGTKKYRAKAEWVGHDCDLAILAVPDEEFFASIAPLEIASTIAPVQTEIKVLGYPMGGEELSVTKGIISRTEVQRYAYSGNALLCSQIDASINPGNSGGPVLENGVVVGVVHQAMYAGQNIGYMIPSPVIQHFLKEVDEGEYQGFPIGGTQFQTMENAALRSFYHLERGETGVLIVTVKEDSFLNKVLFPGDVLLSIDGIPIANDGTIDFEDRKRVSLFYLFSLKYYGELIDLGILRNGEKITCSVLIENKCLMRNPPGVIECRTRPTYYTNGGLVFQPLTMNYLADSIENQSLPINLLRYLGNETIGKECSQVVVLTRVLPDLVNVGYQMLSNEVVTSVNGMRVKSMEDLIRAFEDCEAPFYCIFLDSDIEIVLDREEVLRRREKIMQNYFIHHDRSQDLR